jgi:hypothetical protein
MLWLTGKPLLSAKLLNWSIVSASGKCGEDCLRNRRTGVKPNTDLESARKIRFGAHYLKENRQKVSYFYNFCNKQRNIITHKHDFELESNLHIKITMKKK